MRLVRGSLVVSMLAATLAVTAPGASATRDQAAPSRIHFSGANAGVSGPLTALQRRAMQGALPSDAGELRAQKAAATARFSARTVARGATRRPARSPAPTLKASWQGIGADGFTSPSDSTGAIGPDSYIENVNSNVQLYDRTGGTIASDSLNNWWNEGGDVFDPQVMWDATTSRFYYTGDIINSSSDNRLAFGFSTSANPTSLTGVDWCRYNLAYGSNFPDYPKLGDSRDFFIIGVNVFAPSFIGSDIVALSKPAAGTSCPDPSSFKLDIGGPLSTPAGAQFTPTPAIEVDSNGTGYVVTRSSSLPASNIGVFTVKNDGAGNPVVDVTGSAVTVPTYTYPPPAPQQGTSRTLDTSDARLPQAVAAVDPLRGGKLRVWTQHAVAGGAGSVQRWYEINPQSASLVQSGTVKSSSLYLFDGAISPDRVVNDSGSAYGGNMVMSFASSSSSTFPTIQMVSKRGTLRTSSMVVVKASPGADTDFTCTPTCRWGDYAAANPDPAASLTANTGVVWLTNMWTNTGSSSTTSWQTWNWAAKP